MRELLDLVPSEVERCETSQTEHGDRERGETVAGEVKTLKGRLEASEGDLD